MKPKPFHELLKLNFIIPSYQRGYRWDNEQVEALLNDLYDFIKRSAKHKGSGGNTPEPYYCLQPITVVHDSSDADSYIVVDGQQRLTTIYLLLHFLRNEEEWNYPIYSLHMSSRDLQDKFLADKDFMKPDCDTSSNIDIFYIKKAFDTMATWFKADNKRAQNKDAFRKLFAYEPDDSEDYRDVRIIWYEISDTTALDAFRRLNYGKIPLTPTDLVKALLLEGGADAADGQHTRGTAYRRALEWDSMEHALQEPYFWAMLSADEVPSHLDVVLDFVADRLNKSMAETDGGKLPFVRKDKSDLPDYFNYNVVNEYLHRRGDDGTDHVWNEICRTFNLICNWFANRQWYHLIGLLRILPDKKSKMTRRKFVQHIYNLSVDDKGKPVDRPLFTVRLKGEIGRMVKLPDGLTPANLSYIENNHHDIVKILTLLNVQEALNDNTTGSRFAFHLFEQFKVTSLEHIHPQNISTNAPFDEFREWVERRGKDFAELDDIDFSKVAAGNGFEGEAADEEAKRLRADADDALAVLKEFANDSDMYADDNQKATLDDAVSRFDKFFGELSGISEKELHSISNLALLDQPTNSALQNCFLDQKRKLLMQRHERCNLDDKQSSTYAPPATRKVFCKGYTRCPAGDMRLWQEADRKNYLAAIERVYNYYTSYFNPKT